jgi:formylmethanofuran dehydrogenase subunit E
LSPRISQETLDQVIAFHGHLCPGLMTGVRVAQIALREIGPHAADEEVVAVVETDNCAVDAIQFMVGCTFGKGNLIHADYGKNAFTFARRSDGRAIRIVRKESPARHEDTSPQAAEERALIERVRTGRGNPEDEAVFDELWRRRSLAVLEPEDDELFDVQELHDYRIPDRAELHRSFPCSACGETTMATRLRRLGEQDLCIPCYEAAVEGGGQKGGRLVFRPIGMVHSALTADTAAPRERAEASIHVYPEFSAGLLGIEGFERLQVLFVFHRAPANAPLHQHPRGDQTVPRRGVFALRSPHRPNPIGLTTVRLLAVEGNVLRVDGLDAWDGSPVLDIKPYVEEKGGKATEGSQMR